MNRVAIYILIGLFCVAVATASAQSPTYTPDQIERVAKLSELYGHIKFFHPYPGYKPINWDSAFAAMAPQVANAQTDEETVSAIRQLLGVLNDEATIVQQTTKRAATATSPADSMQVYAYARQYAGPQNQRLRGCVGLRTQHRKSGNARQSVAPCAGRSSRFAQQPATVRF